MGKAEIEGLKSETEEAKVVDLEEVLENTRQAYMVDLALSQEAAKMALGEYSDEYIYNLPRASNSGKEDWGILCDKMPGGYCYYRAKNIKHVHTVGVNINGAIAIMNAYMGLSIKPSEPVIKEFTIMQNGKLVSKAYWSTIVHISNKKTETELELPFLQDVMQKAGDGYIYNEYGSQICVSKGMRNAILKVVPENFQKAWIEEYKGNKAQTTPAKKDKPAEKPKATEKESEPNETKTADSVIAHINEIDNIKHLENWYAKNSVWLNSQKAEDKAKIVNVYNQKQAELDKPNEANNGNNGTFNPATKGQYDTIQKLAEKKGYNKEQMESMCLTIVGIDDVADMSFEQAAQVISDLQK